MNAQQYIALLKQPAGLHQLTLAELQDATAQYPYVAGLQALLLKKYQLLQQEDDYINTLPLVALTVPDRTMLHAWVQTEVPEPQPNDLHHQVEEKLDETLKEALDQEEGEAIAHALHIAEEEQPEAPEPTPPSTTENVAAEAEPETKAAEEAPEEETQQEEEAEDEEPREFTGFPIPDLAILGDIAKAITTPKKRPEETTPEPVAPASRMSFSAWLKQVENNNTATPQPDQLDDIIRTGSYEAALLKESAEIEKGLPQADNSAAVADDDEGRAIAQKAKRSAEMADENVTETLAQILAMQKKYDKAIEAYQKLIIRFPEKQAYFEDKIKLIQNK